MPIQISVIIPCYNQAHFLGEAIESVLAQGRNDVEIIVVNDGSSDDTAAVAQQYGDAVVYIEQANQGAAAARNTGIQAARAPYIAFLDADDAYLPEALQKLAAYLDTHPSVGLVCADALRFDANGDIDLKSSWDGAPRQTGSVRWRTVDYHVNTNTVMVRRAVLDTVGLFKHELQNAAEDRHMWIRIERCYEMTYLAAPLVRYRQHPTSLTRQTEQISAGNRLAVRDIVESDEFAAYPAHFRAKVLYYRFATAWRVEPKTRALGIFWRALITDPRQISYLLQTVKLAIRRLDPKRGTQQEQRRGDISKPPFPTITPTVTPDSHSRTGIEP